MNPDLIFTKHALKRIYERGIEPKDIRDVITQPIWTEFQDEVLVSQSLVRGRILRVFYLKDNDKYTIITSYFTSKKKYQGGGNE